MEYVVSILAILVPSTVTLITSSKQLRLSKMHSARQSIMQLILEDHVRVQEHKLPENKQNILHEYDDYIAAGGNSYIIGKVKEYENWYSQINK